MESTRSIQAILFTDIVNSTARAAELGDHAWRVLLRKHHALVRRRLALHAGREVSTAGDGFLATFGQPAEAIRCACAIRDGVRGLGLEIRGGVHMGEVEWEEKTVGGIAVHIGARVAAEAGASEILVSSTVRELVAGSGFGFEDRGAHALKGVPGEWRLFAVTSCPAAVEDGGPRRLKHGHAVLLGASSFLMLFLLAGLYVGLHERILQPGKDRFSHSAEAPGSSGAPESTYAHRITVPAAAPEQRVAGPESTTTPGIGLPGSTATPVTAAPESPPAPTAATPEVTPPPLPAPGADARLPDEAERRSAEQAHAAARSQLAKLKDSIRTTRASADDGSPAFAEGRDLERRSAAAERQGRYEEALGLLIGAQSSYRTAARPVAVSPVPEQPAPGERETPPEAPAAATTPRETPPEAPPAAAAQPPAGRAAEAAPEAPEPIARGVLAELARAIEAEDLGALRRTWISLSGEDADNFRKWFKGVRDIQVRYDVRSLERSGERIVASVQTTYEAFNESADRKDVQAFGQVLELEERDGRWVVVGSRQ